MDFVDLDANKPENDERIVLFKLDGEEYSIPKKPRANMALKYLRLTREHGERRAGAFLLEDLLGTENYEALMNYDDLTQEQLEHVMEIAQMHVLGEIEEAGKDD